MASTSTGYNKTGIWKEQFSTDGQVMRWSSGSKAYFSADAEIEMESGSTMNVESGAVLNVSGKQQVKSGGEVELESGSTLHVESGGSVKVNSGGLFKVQSGGIFAGQPLTQITSSGIYGTTVPFGGAYWLNPTSSGNVTVHLAAPSFAGQRTMFLVSNSSKKKARIVMTTTTVTVGASSGRQIICSTASLIGTNKIKGYNRHVVELMAMTTLAVAIIQPATTAQVGVSLSSAKTS